MWRYTVAKSGEVVTFESVMGVLDAMTEKISLYYVLEYGPSPVTLMENFNLFWEGVLFCFVNHIMNLPPLHFTYLKPFTI